MLGDQPAQYTFADYRDVDGVKLPHKITIVKGGKPYSEVQFARRRSTIAAAVAISRFPRRPTTRSTKPIAAGDYSPVTLAKIADGVFFARAYSHNSLVVEFPSYLAVVEAAYTDAQSATLARVLPSSSPASRSATPRSRTSTTTTPAACAGWPRWAPPSSPRRTTSR